jgi:hypothetical protein
MAERPRKRPRDTNQLAKLIVDMATGEVQEIGDTRDLAAVKRGRLGGEKGGPARAQALSKARRVEIAKKAARTRWKAPVHND